MYRVMADTHNRQSAEGFDRLSEWIPLRQVLSSPSGIVGMPSVWPEGRWLSRGSFLSWKNPSRIEQMSPNKQISNIEINFIRSICYHSNHSLLFKTIRGGVFGPLLFVISDGAEGGI